MLPLVLNGILLKVMRLQFILSALIKKKTSRWDRALIFLLKMLVILVAVIAALAYLLEYPKICHWQFFLG